MDNDDDDTTSDKNHSTENDDAQKRISNQVVTPVSAVPSTSTVVSQKQSPPQFSTRTAVGLIALQSLIILLAVLCAWIFKTPNYGLGVSFELNLAAFQQGLLWTIPLGLVAVLLDLFEDRFPALQNVTKATLRSVLILLGGSFRPFLALLVASVLGTVAGLGEELLFRGVFQYQLSLFTATLLPKVSLTGLTSPSAISIGLTSIVFGALHAVTPLYSILATLASVYFGTLYLTYGENLAVPIICHALYDVGALLFAHWTVCKMSRQEQVAISESGESH